MLDAISSILPGIIAAVSGVILFMRAGKNKNPAGRRFFRHYALAFIIIATANIPIFLMNLGVTISFGSLHLIYALIIFIKLISYLLFFRGTALLFSEDRLFPTLLPLLVLPAVAAFSLASLFFLNFSSIIIYTAIAWGFLFVNNNLLGTFFLYSFATGSPIANLKRKLCSLLLSLGWFSVLGLDVILWVNAALSHQDFWLLKVISMWEWFLARAIVYLIILVGALLLNKCFQGARAETKEQEALGSAVNNI